MSEFSAIVLGAGVSGLVSAAVLEARLNGPVLLVDEYERVGGNHISVDVGPYTFDIGSFFFQDDSPLLTHFPEMLQVYHDIGRYSISRLTPYGGVSRYPVDVRRDLFGGGPVELARILFSLLSARLRVDPARNAESYMTFWMGRRFAARSGLQGYLERFYGTSPERIEALFTQKRMGWIAEAGSLKGVLGVLRPKKRSAGPTNRQLIRPREGFRPLYAVAAEALRAKGVTIALGAQMQGIDRLEDGRIRLRTAQGEHVAPMMVSTIPVNRALALCGLPEDPRIRSTTLTSLLYSFEGNRNFDSNVLYNFSDGGLWKRLTVFSDFYGEVAGRSYFAVEVVSASEAIAPDAAHADFRRHTEKAGILSGDLRLEGALITGNAYPAYLDGASVAAEAAARQLEEHGILAFGRQGGFDYQPTARVSTLVAEERISAALAPQGRSAPDAAGR
ncbi:MAG: NAD(P)-binding protein [Pseudochelatococcus sp.]|jgi:protoporphyrinogen oxidase|uniref:NAD(P)-binding protein n=1 Tax=Pseudochelatococcus sp. TaxID=2020869 RepID=UPI003D935218